MFKGVASRALGVFALFTVVCGLGYTLIVTGIAQVAFPYQANGSLIKVDDKIVGSELILSLIHIWSPSSSPALMAAASSA